MGGWRGTYGTHVRCLSSDEADEGGDEGDDSEAHAVESEGYEAVEGEGEKESERTIEWARPRDGLIPPGETPSLLLQRRP